MRALNAMDTEDVKFLSGTGRNARREAKFKLRGPIYQIVEMFAFENKISEPEALERLLKKGIEAMPRDYY